MPNPFASTPKFARSAAGQFSRRFADHRLMRRWSTLRAKWAEDQAANRYTAAGWSRGDLVRLADALAAARDRGAYVITTNNATTFALDTFARRGFRCDTVQTTRSVSCDATTRGAVAELIAVGGRAVRI